MMFLWESPVEAAAMVAMTLFSVAVCLPAVRLLHGPTLPDRVVALETTSTLLVGLFVSYGIAEHESEALRVATVLALINFVGTVAFATYIRRRAQR